MSDIHLSDNEIDSIHELRSQMAALQAQLEAVTAGNTSNPFIIESSPSKEIVPNNFLLAAMPSISGENFYSRPKEDIHNLTLDRANFPKNALQSYKAPPVSDLPWPSNASEAQQMDKTLQSIQEHLARITRPIDTFAATVFASQTDDDTKDDIMEFLQVMRSQIADVAYSISDERQDRFLRSRSIKTKSRDGPTPLITTEQFSAKNKESDLTKEAMGFKQSKDSSRQRNKGRSQFGGFRSGGFGWQPQPAYQQQYQQQFTQQQQPALQFAPPQSQTMVPALPGTAQGYPTQGYQGQYFTRGARGRGRGRPQNTQ
ncbi:hypothetical protein BX616_001806 [Lobosporangium transversale]|nr:hypothetical protein BX616_001806 [Lobosporangium transversale]